MSRIPIYHLHQLASALKGSENLGIRVKFKSALNGNDLPGIDAGGLKRDFISRLMLSVCKDERLMDVTGNGLFLPKSMQIF